MLIDGIDIERFNADLLEYDIQPAEITTYRDWLRGASKPLIVAQQETYKDIYAKLMVEGEKEQEVLQNTSNLIDKAKKCTIEFISVDIDFLYDATIETTNTEKFSDTVYVLEITWKSGFAFKPTITETASHVSSKTINVSGNTETPAIVEINPSIDLIDITITGIGEPFTINNLKANQKVIVDGESEMVIQNEKNKFGDFDGWCFPYLKPGENTINFSQSRADIIIKYKPRWK